MFRTVAQSAIDAIILADGDGKIVIWNKSAHTIFGYSEEEVLGKSPTLLMPERCREAHQKGIGTISFYGRDSDNWKDSRGPGAEKRR